MNISAQNFPGAVSLLSVEHDNTRKGYNCGEKKHFDHDGMFDTNTLTADVLTASASQNEHGCVCVCNVRMCTMESVFGPSCV